MGVKAFFTTILNFFKLSIQSLSFFIKAEYKRRKAKAIFQKTLVLNGIPSEVAQELVKTYPNPTREMLILMNIKAT